MPEHDAIRVEGAIWRLDRMTQSPGSADIPAASSETFAALSGMGADIDPAVIVERRRTLKAGLSSDTTRATTLACLTGEGYRLLGDYLDDPSRASLTTELVAMRGIWAFGRSHRVQTTSLQLGFGQGGGVSIDIGGTVPFDRGLQLLTAQVWAEFGLTLECDFNDAGGRYGFYVEGDVEEKIATKLNSLLSTLTTPPSSSS